jgi:hypothetical protein
MRPKPLSKEDILIAMNKTKSNRAAARYLGVSYIHYKGYAKLFKNEEGKSLFEVHKNQCGKGIPKFMGTNGKHTTLLDILEGRIPIEHFSPQKIRDRLLVEGFLDERCYKCDFHEKRIVDLKSPLILNFIDGNKKNYKLSNLELVCYNCYFLYINNLFTDKQLTHLEDFKSVPKAQEIDWELDQRFEEHFKEIGLASEENEEMDGSEYISKLK